MSLIVRIIPDGSIEFDGFEEETLSLLSDLPKILEHRSDPRVRIRMFPNIIPNDQKANEAWHDVMDAELEYLFSSAEELIVKDLQMLDQDGVLRVPPKHFKGWMSGLNQARILLGELYGLGEEDMRGIEFHEIGEKEAAVYRVHFYGMLMHVFVDVESGAWRNDDRGLLE